MFLGDDQDMCLCGGLIDVVNGKKGVVLIEELLGLVA